MMMALSRPVFAGCRSGRTRVLIAPRSSSLCCRQVGRGAQHGDRSQRSIKAGATLVGEQGEGETGPRSISSPIESVLHYATALYQFSRPHTMIGTALSVVSISLLALGGADMGIQAGIALVQALTSALLMNIAIVGINQLYDIDIDKVNKPYLPLASGALTPGQGLSIVLASAAGGTLIGLASGSPALIATLLISLVLGVLYSAELPFMRWKRSPVLAAGCILAVRAIIVQLGFYSHMRDALALAVTATSAPPGIASASIAPAASVAAAAAATATATSTAAAAATAGAGGGGAASGGLLFCLAPLSHLSPSVLFVISFMLFFSIVIALFKDIPDVVGDRKAGVRTLSVRMGEGSVFRICVGMLTAAYCWAMAASLALPQGNLARGVLFAGHAVLCFLLISRSRTVDTRKKADLTDYYMFVWKLFYAEYLLIPLFG